MSSHKTLLPALSALALAATVAGGAKADEDAKLVQTNLVSDMVGLAAVTDSNLKNPWGVSHSPTSRLQ